MDQRMEASSSSQFVRAVYDPHNRFSDLIAHLQLWGKPRGHCVVALGGTETSDRDGISAAGATAELRRQTPANDAEALILGRTVSGGSLPVSPEGIVSPVVLTRPCLRLADVGVTIADCGTFRSPQVAVERVGKKPARCLSTGKALTLAEVNDLFDAGQSMGKSLASDLDYLVVAECVPGGTTTALAVLTALGFQVQGILSTSLPTANHNARHELVQSGLASCALTVEEALDEPLKAVAALGDPMQPFAAGLALAASSSRPVILAGGSQMLCVYAITALLAGNDHIDIAERRVATITTKWVAYDANADLLLLSRLTGAPLGASCPDFTQSRHEGLRAYENGHVKEGIGAGAAMALAHVVGGVSGAEILLAIDDSYDEMTALATA